MDCWRPHFLPLDPRWFDLNLTVQDKTNTRLQRYRPAPRRPGSALLLAVPCLSVSRGSPLDRNTECTDQRACKPLASLRLCHREPEVSAGEAILGRQRAFFADPVCDHLDCDSTWN